MSRTLPEWRWGSPSAAEGSVMVVLQWLGQREVARPTGRPHSPGLPRDDDCRPLYHRWWLPTAGSDTHAAGADGPVPGDSFAGEAVAVSDLGFAAWRHDGPEVDLWGLASIEEVRGSSRPPLRRGVHGRARAGALGARDRDLRLLDQRPARRCAELLGARRAVVSRGRHDPHRRRSIRDLVRADGSTTR